MTASTLPVAHPIASRLGVAWARVSAHLDDRSRRLVAFLDARMDRVIGIWTVMLLGVAVAKIATAPGGVANLGEAIALLLPYLLVIASPIAGYRVARSAFPRGHAAGQPALRLAQYGRWEKIDVVEARSDRLFGASGLLASLLLGLLLDVPMRTLEYLAAVPAVSAGAPMWAQVYFTAMTAQLVMLNFFGMVALVMALRNVPLFPRMLLFLWLFDLVLQLTVATQIASAPGYPATAVVPLVTLLQNNIRKVLISMLVWLPYLLLSERVNVTYRQRRSLRVA